MTKAMVTVDTAGITRAVCGRSAYDVCNIPTGIKKLYGVDTRKRYH